MEFTPHACPGWIRRSGTTGTLGDVSELSVRVDKFSLPSSDGAEDTRMAKKVIARNISCKQALKIS